MKKRTFTRRDFLKAAAVAPLAGAIASSGLSAGAAGPAARPAGAQTAASVSKSRVILIRDKDVLGADRKSLPSVVGRMLDEAVAALFGEKDASAAWKRIIRPEDTVGIKTNAWKYLATGPEIDAQGLLNVAKSSTLHRFNELSHFSLILRYITVSEQEENMDWGYALQGNLPPFAVFHA